MKKSIVAALAIVLLAVGVVADETEQLESLFGIPGESTFEEARDTFAAVMPYSDPDLDVTNGRLGVFYVNYAGVDTWDAAIFYVFDSSGILRASFLHSKDRALIDDILHDSFGIADYMNQERDMYWIFEDVGWAIARIADPDSDGYYIAGTISKEVYEADLGMR